MISQVEIKTCMHIVGIKLSNAQISKLSEALPMNRLEGKYDYLRMIDLMFGSVKLNEFRVKYQINPHMDSQQTHQPLEITARMKGLIEIHMAELKLRIYAISRNGHVDQNAFLASF